MQNPLKAQGGLNRALAKSRSYLNQQLVSTQSLDILHSRSLQTAEAIPKVMCSQSEIVRHPPDRMENLGRISEVPLLACISAGMGMTFCLFSCGCRSGSASILLAAAVPGMRNGGLGPQYSPPYCRSLAIGWPRYCRWTLHPRQLRTFNGRIWSLVSDAVNRGTTKYFQQQVLHCL